MNPLAANLIRTYVPVVVGAAVSWLVAHGLQVDPATSAAAITMMTGLFTAAYYTIARVLEEKFPGLGAILLLSRSPVSLHIAGECPAVAEHEDYGEGWPPRDDRPGVYDPEPPDGGNVVPPPPQQYAPAPPLATTRQGGLADLVAQTRPDVRPRKADTGAIPAYRRPAGR